MGLDGGVAHDDLGVAKDATLAPLRQQTIGNRRPSGGRIVGSVRARLAGRGAAILRPISPPTPDRRPPVTVGWTPAS